MKIVILDGYTLNPGDLSWDGFHSLGDVTYYDRTSDEDIIERIGDAEIVITNKTPLTEYTLSKTNIKYIGVLATGYNIVDIQAATKRHIVVTHVPNYGTQTVAQHTMALLLEICHHVGHHSASVKNGLWHKQDDFCYWHHPIIELSGKTLGIIGLGRIGKAVYRLAEAFGLRVIAYSRTPQEDYDCVSLETLYQSSDIISLHCPLTEETRSIINEESIQKMKDQVILLNTSRGQLIDQDALYQGLICNKIYGAAIDVLDIEPPRKKHPLMDLDNCIITPHIAWASKEARMRLLTIATDNLKAFLNGQPIHQVSRHI